MAYDPELERKFANLAESAKSSPKAQVEAAESIFRDALLTSAAEIVHLATNGDRETTRLAAAKYVCDRMLPRPDGAGGSDPLTDFMNQVKSKANNN